MTSLNGNIFRSPVNSPHTGQWRGALMFSVICARINGWVNNGEAGDLRRHRVHYDVTVMFIPEKWSKSPSCGEAKHVSAIFITIYGMFSVLFKAMIVLYIYDKDKIVTVWMQIHCTHILGILSSKVLQYNSLSQRCGLKFVRKAFIWYMYYVLQRVGVDGLEKWKTVLNSFQGALNRTSLH